jgi:hypothetical protein
MICLAAHTGDRSLSITDLFVVFGLVFVLFWRSDKGARSFYFNPEDFITMRKTGQGTPVSVSSGTFEPMLAHYVGAFYQKIARKPDHSHDIGDIGDM